MKVRVNQRRLGEIPAGALLMLPLFMLPLGAQLVGSGEIHLGLCGFKALLGLPCLTCGSTRATMHLFHGDLAQAIQHQPMMMFIYLSVTLWGVVSFWAFVTHKSVRFRLSDREDLALKIAIIGIPVSNWFYLVWAGI